MTIANIRGCAQAQTLSYTTMMLRLLPVPLKFKQKMKRWYRTAQQNCNSVVLKEALGIIPEQLMPGGKRIMIVYCVDVQRQECYLRYLISIAGYPEYYELPGLKPGSRIFCKCSRTELSHLNNHAR